ncbi:MAG: sugar phosphate isomerase/epimerase [Verrucomicrobia bacterium]|nr:sugar phosphate isomerase/epimerase [Verrucomicrobiota bacterium]
MIPIDFSRRNFIRTTALGATGLGLIGPQIESWGAKPPKSFPGIGGVHLAIATICTDGFGNHRHEPAFRVIPELGFKNVEFNLWYPELVTSSYIESLRQRCYAAGLTPISLQGSGFGGEGRTAVIKDLSHKIVLLDGCERLGCQIVKCTGSKRGTQGGLKSVIEVCRQLAPVAEEKGMLVVLENHANNVLENIGDFEEIFSAIDFPNIGMCLDTGHFEGVSVDLHEVIDKFHERILHVDLKDCRERGKGHDTVVFGQGVTDFDAFLSHLKEKSFKGYLVVEQAWSEPKGDWVSDLQKAYTRFKRWES